MWYCRVSTEEKGIRQGTSIYTAYCFLTLIYTAYHFLNMQKLSCPLFLLSTFYFTYIYPVAPVISLWISQTRFILVAGVDCPLHKSLSYFTNMVLTLLPNTPSNLQVGFPHLHWGSKCCSASDSPGDVSMCAPEMLCFLE